MTTLQLLIVCATAVVLALIATHAYGAHHSTGRRPVGGTLGAPLVVHTADGHTLRGLLVEVGPEFALSDAAYVQEGTEHPMGGVVRVPYGNVAWTQALPRPDGVPA